MTKETLNEIKIIREIRKSPSFYKHRRHCLMHIYSFQPQTYVRLQEICPPPLVLYHCSWKPAERFFSLLFDLVGWEEWVFENCAARSNTGTSTSACLWCKPRAIYGSHYSDQLVQENVRMVTAEDLEVPGKL